MSLFDVDKSGRRRDVPVPNRHDQLLEGAMKAHGTNSVNFTTDASPASQAHIFGGNARLVAQGTGVVAAPDGSPGVIVTTTSTLAHGLGYTPIVTAYMNNITGSGFGIQLPMWVSFSAETGLAGGATEILGVTRYMTCAVDGTNVYILTYSSGSAVAANFAITYYLYQQRAQ